MYRAQSDGVLHKIKYSPLLGARKVFGEEVLAGWNASIEKNVDTIVGSFPTAFRALAPRLGRGREGSALALLDTQMGPPSQSETVDHKSLLQ